MDGTTWIGVAGLAALLWAGVRFGELTSVLWNSHGIAIVLGGTCIALCLNTPSRYLVAAARAFIGLLAKPAYPAPAEVVSVMVALSEAARIRGLAAFKNADATVAGGFLAKASHVALEKNDPQFVRRVLEDEINRAADEQNEVINVIRTTALLAPMFGLLGTLLGIIKVLRELSNPAELGMSMALAITSAFYGILLSNLVCIPAAGKLRIRSWEELVCKSIVLEGIIEIMAGAIPMQVERRLDALAQQKRQQETAGTGAA